MGRAHEGFDALRPEGGLGQVGAGHPLLASKQRVSGLGFRGLGFRV